MVISTDRKPLESVNIILHGTGLGDATDRQGIYRISTVPDGSYLISASIIGYHTVTREVNLKGIATVDFVLRETIVQLSDVTVTGTFATENSIPITFTTLQEQEISDRYTFQDIPMILSDKPGVYVTTDGGSGLGDSRIMIRGFDERRIQVLVNNIPVNDPESKQVFWSSWGILPAVAQTIQIQRGVGSSLYGSGALGGSINIITKDASAVKSTKFVTTLGQYGIRKMGFHYNSGLLNGNSSFLASVNFLEGNGWRKNTFYRGFLYYFSLSFIPDHRHTLKLILHGSPQYHTLSYYSFDAATYGNPDQFSEKSSIGGGIGQKNEFGQHAYGFGRSFNGNVHVAKDELPSGQLNRSNSIWDALFMKAKIGASPENQVGGLILTADRASFDNNVSHRPQWEIHHNWKITGSTKLTSTYFFTKGIDYSDNIYPYYFIPREKTGIFSYRTIYDGDYYGGDQVFQYRYYSDFLQTGLLSALEIHHLNHEFSAGIESRYWKSRHAGEMLDTFGKKQVNVKVGSVEHTFAEGDLFYDFETEKPQITLFGRALWDLGQKVDLLTTFQISGMRYHIFEHIPSNNNYPNHLDPTAATSHGGDSWTGNAKWDHDSDPSTPEKFVKYSLWDYTQSYRYFTPRIGVNYQISRKANFFANWSAGIREPQVKHFFGYGSPRDEIDLEKTEDIELGFRFEGFINNYPFFLQLNSYRIFFMGKLMQITVPEKANTPGYDYAGHYYVPIGEAEYRGMELEWNSEIPFGIRLGINLSKSSNIWGEPDGSEGSQKLFGNDAIAGIDYVDANSNGRWDEGNLEHALHRNFVKKYGARYEVGMPQFMVGARLGWEIGFWSFNTTVKYFEDIYLLEDNSKIRLDPGADNLFGTPDDTFSAKLLPATLLDMKISYALSLWEKTLSVNLHVNNILNLDYWQRGDEYGVAPGPRRMIVFNTELVW